MQHLIARADGVLELPCLIYRRAKLFTYGETMLDRGTGLKSWKEKGVGDIKFLK